MFDKIINKLNQSIFEDRDDSEINAYEVLLAESIEEISTNKNFFSLPTENVLSIIKKSKISNIKVLSTLVNSMSLYKDEESPLILNVIDSDEGSLSDYIDIISNLKNCPICNRIFNIRIRDKNLPFIDYNRKIKELESYVQELEAKISAYKKRAAIKPEKPTNCTDNIFDASKKGDLASVKYFIENVGVDANTKDRDGETPLHYACCNGHLDIVKYMIEDCDADKAVKNNDGVSPLHYASGSDRLDIVKYLIEERKANIEISDNNGDTPLHYASKFGHVDIAKYLIEEGGANKEAQNNFRYTPSYYAGIMCSGDKKEHIKEYFGIKE